MKKFLVAMLTLALLSACAAANGPASSRNLKVGDAVTIAAPDSPHPTREVSHNNGR